jgi:drug/metabolite transporter (DMT)-like permease
MLGGGLLGLVASFSMETAPYITEFAPFVALLIAIIFISNCFTHVIYIRLLKHYSLTLLQMGSLLVPFMTHGAQIVLMQKKCTVSWCSAALLVIAGCWLFYRQEQKEQKTEDVRAYSNDGEAI